MPDFYDVRLTSQAEKDLDDLKTWREQVELELLELEGNPTKGHTLKQSLRGCRSLEFNLKGGGAYRAVYVLLDSEDVCLVFLIGPHEGIYAKAERRLKSLRKRYVIRFG